MSNNDIETNENIDIYSIINLLIDNIKLIALTILIFFIVGLLYIYFTEKKVTAEIDINAISAKDISKFSGINVAVNEYAEFLNENKNSSNLFNREYLKESFKYEMLNYRLLLNRFEKELIKKNSLSEPTAKNQAINIVKGIKIKSGKELLDTDKLQFQFNIDDRALYIDSLSQAIVDINQKIYNDLLITLNNAVSSILSSKERSTNLLGKELLVLEKKFNLEKKQKQVFLEEQKKIALALGIKTHDKNISNEIVVESSSSKNDPSIEFNSYSDNNYYLNGYDAITQELNILSNRDETNIENYSIEYAQKLTELERIKLNDDADNLKLALNTMPSSDEFKAVYIDLEFIKLSMLSNSRILLIFLLLGTFVSLVLIFLVQAYKSKH